MSTQIDLLTALKLLQATATEEVKPILKAAIEEIERLRQEAKTEWPHTTEHIYANTTDILQKTTKRPDPTSEPPTHR